MYRITAHASLSFHTHAQHVSKGACPAIVKLMYACMTALPFCLSGLVGFTWLHQRSLNTSSPAAAAPILLLQHLPQGVCICQHHNGESMRLCL